MSQQATKIAKLDIGIKNESLEESVRATSHLLAATYALYLKTQYYHWNIVGAEFYNLHIMFEAQYKELRESIDDIAERIRALGGIAPGTFHEFSELNFIEEDRQVPDNWQKMVANLQIGHELIVKECRGLIGRFQSSKDEGTADMLTERIKYHEKTSWMLRSLNNAKHV